MKSEPSQSIVNAAAACPCCSGKSYGECCKPFHAGTAQADTAEKLMRSRYAAYVVGNIDYIGVTNDPASGDNFDREAAEAWSKQSQWKGLEIIATKDGKAGDLQGEVEFRAHFVTEGKEMTHHEVSLFNFKNGRWYYSDGKDVLAPIQRTEPKTGRNDPCTCGSGKKYKKCCAA